MQSQNQNENSTAPSGPPAQSSQPLTSDSWRHALIPWKEGGKPYTYMLPPGIECAPGYWAMVVKPNGTPSVFQITSIEDHTPTTFQLKPIANCWSDEQWQEMVQAAHPEKPAISMHEDFPQWTTEVADMFVEGR